MSPLNLLLILGLLSAALGEGPCSFMLNGHLYDLSGLEGVYQGRDPNTTDVYNVSPCSMIPAAQDDCPLSGYGCGKSIRDNQSFTLATLYRFAVIEGEVTRNPNVRVHYNTGSYCNEHFINRGMSIHYRCGTEVGAPIFFWNEECHYHFDFQTKYACVTPPEVPLSCQFSQAGKNYDFSPLGGTWIISERISGFFYFLNPCGSLNLTSPAACVGSQGCQSPMHNLATGYSIGETLTEIYPGIGSPSSVVIFRITGGDFCSGMAAPRTTEITFGCGMGLGQPEFVSEMACFYRFKWLTSLAC